jgi:DNA-binding transcriptional ArsR family regulator
MTKKLSHTELAHLSRFAKAMGHPTRMEILHFLAGQETCYFGDIHDVFPNAKATISQHLKELKNAELIQGEFELPKVKYCINKGNWELAQKMFSDFFNTEIKNNCCK